MTTPSFNSIVDDAAQPYANVSRYAYHFTRNKLRYDPVFRALLQQGLLPDHGHLLDHCFIFECNVGCRDFPVQQFYSL